MPFIVITGVSTGIGRAAAARFARAGWRVVGTVRDSAKSSIGGAAPAASMPPRTPPPSAQERRSPSR